MAPEQEPKSWSEKINSLRQRESAAISKAYALKDLQQQDFEELTLNFDFHDNVHISLILRPEEFETAPDEIKMIFNDLGINESAKITAEMALGNPKTHYYRNSVELSFNPEEISEDQFGITIKNLQSHQIHAPTRKEFDWIHQCHWTRYGKGADLARLYEDHLDRNRSCPNPYSLEILEAGVNWFTELVESRKKPPTIFSRDWITSNEPL